MVRRRRLACLLPVIVFLALRALSHAHPAPLPWTSGVFDADGFDDLLQSIRIAYTQPREPHRVTAGSVMPTGRVSVSEPLAAGVIFFSTARSRAPPSA